MKKFALLALVLAFAGLAVAGCPDNKAGNAAPTNAGNAAK